MTVEQLDAECAAALADGDHQKAARIAFKFRDYAANDSRFDEAEKLARIANAYYWLCKATFKQVEKASEDQLYELLVAFFAAHKMGTYSIQKIIKKDILTLDQRHPMSPRHREINELYEKIYRLYPGEATERADMEANARTPI